MKTQRQKNEYQRAYRERTKNSCTNKYEKTVNGFLMRKYRNMQSRVSGVQKLKSHLYKDLYLLPRNEFYAWANWNKEFWNLYNKWVESNYNRKLCPTVDRIDSNKGYLLENMRWVTHSENSRLGAMNK